MAVKLRKSPMQIKGQVTRLRVFAAVKRVMETEGRCPTCEEIGRNLGIGATTAGLHMRALDGAVGLPLSMDGALRLAQGRERNVNSDDWRAALAAGRSISNAKRGFRADENNIPVDILLAGEA